MAYDYPNKLTKKDVKSALIEKGLLNESDLKLLRYQYQMKNNTATATQLGKLLGYRRYTAVNLHYARIAKKISEFTGKYPFKRKNGSYRWWSLLSIGEEKGMSYPWRLRKIVIEAITELNFFEEGEGIFPEEISVKSKVLNEGAVKQVLVNSYERNTRARNECIEFHGTNCIVCGFDFEDVFGEFGKDFIHVHHLTPISEIKKDYIVNPMTDMIPVCPNCHAMIHRTDPILTIVEIKKIIKENAR